MDYEALNDFPEILYQISQIDGSIRFWWKNIRKVAEKTKPEFDHYERQRIDTCRLLLAAYEEGAQRP